MEKAKKDEILVKAKKDEILVKAKVWMQKNIVEPHVRNKKNYQALMK